MDLVGISRVDNPIKTLSRFLAFRVGGSFANANEDVYATVLGQFSKSGDFYVRVLPGWLRKDEVDNPVFEKTISRVAN